MSLDEPEDDYWTASSVKSSKRKVNIFDDSVTVEAASDLAKFQKSFADDVEEESIGWGDDPVSSVAMTPSKDPALSRPTPSSSIKQDSSSKQPPASSSLPRPSFQPHYTDTSVPSSSTSYMTHSRSRSDVIVGSMNKMSLVKSPSTPNPKDIRVDSEPDLTSVIGNSSKKSDSKPLSRQEQQIQFLEQQLMLAKKAIVSTQISVDETIKRIILGQSYSLEQYKSKEDKLLLLDKAIASHDGNAIIAAVIFMKRTLTDALFNLELLRRPVAVDQYLAYLKAHYNLNAYANMLEMLNRTEELAMFKYKQSVSVNDPAAKIQRVKGCLQSYFEMSPSLQHECGLLKQQVSLLERQRPVDVGDEMIEQEGKHLVFRQHPRKASIINMPVITTLFYCCIYHYEEPENYLSSPASLRKEHQLTEKQYIWTAVRARAMLRRWPDIEALFLTKGFFGSKMKSVIGFDKVASILHKADAPPEILNKYLQLVDDVDRRLEIAQKMQCHDAVIETYRNQRDRQSLQTYFSRLKPNSREWYVAQGVLNDQTVKWK
ncbi:spermatogenesis-defective protein 39 [Mactra antiquata]